MRLLVQEQFFATRMAQDLHVKLTIALIYTCNPALKGEAGQDMKGLARQKEYVRESFEQWRATLKEVVLEFRLVSVDGPLCEPVPPHPSSKASLRRYSFAKS